MHRKQIVRLVGLTETIRWESWAVYKLTMKILYKYHLYRSCFISELFRISLTFLTNCFKSIRYYILHSTVSHRFDVRSRYCGVFNTSTETWWHSREESAEIAETVREKFWWCYELNHISFPGQPSHFMMLQLAITHLLAKEVHTFSQFIYTVSSAACSLADCGIRLWACSVEQMVFCT